MENAGDDILNESPKSYRNDEPQSRQDVSKNGKKEGNPDLSRIWSEGFISPLISPKLEPFFLHFFLLVRVSQISSSRISAIRNKADEAENYILSQKTKPHPPFALCQLSQLSQLRMTVLKNSIRWLCRPSPPSLK